LQTLYLSYLVGRLELQVCCSKFRHRQFVIVDPPQWEPARTAYKYRADPFACERIANLLDRICEVLRREQCAICTSVTRA